MAGKLGEFLRSYIERIPGSNKLYHVMIYVLFCALYVFISRSVDRVGKETFFTWTFPLPLVVLGFFFSGRSLEVRLVSGIAGGACSYLFLFLAVELYRPVNVVPHIASMEALLLSVGMVSVGALHGAVFSLALYGTCKMVRLCRPREPSDRGVGGS